MSEGRGWFLGCSVPLTFGVFVSLVVLLGPNRSRGADPLASLGIALAVGFGLIVFGAIARRSRRYGNRLRYVAVAIGLATIFATLVAFLAWIGAAYEACFRITC